MVEDDDVNKDDKFEFDSTSEVVEYALLGQSELIAIQDVRNEPGNYGRQYEGVKMVYTVEHQKERADYHVITLFFGLKVTGMAEAGKNDSLSRKKAWSLTVSY